MVGCLDLVDRLKNGDDRATGGTPVGGASSTWEADSVPELTLIFGGSLEFETDCVARTGGDSISISEGIAAIGNNQYDERP